MSSWSNPKPLLENNGQERLSTEIGESNSWYVFMNGNFVKSPNIIAMAEPHPITVLGGRDHMNGRFDPTSEVCGGFIRYKHERYDLWLEYNDERQQWHIKPEVNKGTTLAWAYATFKCRGAPDSRPADWFSYTASTGFTQAVGMVIIKSCVSIKISNAAGSVGNQVNGYYDPTEELCGGWVRYKKRGERENVWMEYFAEKGQWHVKPASSKMTTNAWAYATCKPAMAPTEVADCWKLYDGAKFVDYRDVVIENADEPE